MFTDTVHSTTGNGGAVQYVTSLMDDGDWDTSPPPSQQEKELDEVDIGDETVIINKAWKPRLITIEPVLVFFGIAASLMDLTTKALIYHKVCLANFPQNICDHLHNETYVDAEKTVQSIVSHWLLYTQVLYYVPAFLLTFTVFGTFSDKVSRRAAIAIPALGHLLQAVTLLFTAVFMDSHVGYTGLGALLSGLSGGWVSMFMAMFSYLGEASAPERRTFRVSVAEGVASSSSVIALLVGGVLLDHTNYITVFSIICVIFLLCPIYIYAYMTEPPRSTKHVSRTSIGQGGTCFRMWMSLRDSAMCVSRKRPQNGRARLLVAFSVVFTATAVILHTYGAIGYLFLRRQPLSWSQTLYGIFSAVLEGSSALGFLVIVPLMKTYLHTSDTALMLIGLSSSILSVGYFGFCTKTWMVFIMPILSLLNGGLWAIRSFVSQLVDAEEQGRMFAVFGTVQAASGIVAPIIFNGLYPPTLNFSPPMPGFSFWLGAVLALIPMAMLGWLHWDVRRTRPFKDRVSDTERIEITDRVKRYGMWTPSERF